MLQRWKRVLAAALTAVMLVSALPTGAYASFSQLIDNGAVKNAALAEALEEAYGADAETYYAILEEYGLLDEEGNLVTNEKVVVDGVAYTLEELEDYLAQPGVDLGKRAEVDGEYYTLEELQKVLEIERELARIQALYFTPQELTDEHIKNFYDLAGAVANGGLQLMAADGDGLGPAGVDHSVRLEVTTDANATLGDPYTVTVTPKKAQSQPITFSWRAVGSSAAGSGNGTIPANSTAPVTLKVDVKPIDEELNGKDSFVVQIYNVKNALFSDGSTRWEKQVTVEKKDPYSNYNTTFDKEFPDFTLTNDSNLIYAYMPTFGNSSGPKGNAALWEGDPFKNAENNYVVERNTQVTVAGLPKGEYEVKAEVHLPFSTFDGEFNSNDTSTEEGQIKRLFEDLPTEYAKGTPISGKDKPAQYRVTISGDYKKEWKGSTGLFNDQKTGYYQHNTITETTDPFYRTVTGSDDKFVYSAKLEETAGVHEFIVLDGSGTTQWPEHARFYGPHEFTYAYLRITVQERTTETTATISAPPGIYYAGQSIPIRVKFDFPMNIGKSNNLTLTVNGEKLEPLHDWVYGEVCTFLYKVTDKSGGKLNLTDFSLNGVGVNGRDITVKLSDASVKKGEDFPGITMEALDRDRAFAGYQTEVKNDAATNQPILTVTVPLDSNKDLTAWVLREVSNGVLNPFQAGTSMTEGKRYPFKVNNTQNPTALLAEIPLPYNSTSGPLTGLVDLWLDGSVLMGKNLTFTVEPSTPVGKFDMNPVLTITPAGGTGEEYVPGKNPPLIYAQQDNTLELDFTLDAKSPPYTWGKLDKVTYYDKDNKLFPLSGGAAPHFAWKSDNTEVAQLVVKDGEHKAVIIPTGKAGTVNFTLTAFNGGPDVDGTVVGMADATTAVITVQFAVGSDPFLNIPAGGRDLAIREEQNAVVSWSSNICQKNQEASTEGNFVETSFQVDVTYIPGVEGATEEKTLTLPQAVTDQLTTSPANPSISSVTIPWMVWEETGEGEGEWVPVLKQAYDEKARSVKVVVTTTYDKKTYGGDDATATIKMTSLPAQVTLAEPEGGLYQIDSEDGRELTLTWSMPHLDETTGGQFELYIASDALETPIVRNLENQDGVTEDGGIWSYTLKAPQVDLKTDPTDPGRYRDSYTVTVKAKNTAETIWASDSYVVYVYAEDALKIMLDGKYLGTSHIMSNVEDIKTMWEKDPTGQSIVDLQRNIALKNMISANHGEFAWAELADMIAWNSSDSTVATVNYQQGTLYENIENFPSAAYRPTDDFILSGLKSGETQVTATHIETEQTKTLDVKVATLRDQLYLFQCYPKQETVLTYSVYTNEARTAISTPRTQTTNGNGEAAIYTEYGIAGDVYCKSVTDAESDEESVTYLGTIYNRSLVSSEADSTKLQLYPVNTIQLRRAAQAVIYLKNPDGTPYQGNVTFRGGVYRDGVYCTGSGEETGVIFGLQTTPQEEWKPGYEPQTEGVEKDGSLTVTMDVTQFMYEGKTDKVEAGDRLYYLFQLDYGDGKQTSHYPLLVRMDATMNAKDVAATGDSIVFWEKNETGAAHPFIIAQNLRYSASPGASVADVRKSTGNVGPSTTFPDAWLTTTVMWWGEEAEETADGEGGTEVEDGTEKPAYSVTLRDTTGKVPGGQTGEVKDYPFTNQTYTETVLKMDRQVMDTWGVGQGERRSLQAMLSKDGTTANATVPLPFKVINMIGVQEAENAGVLGETQNEIKDGLNADMGNLSGIDGMVQAGLKNLAGESKYDSSKDKVAVRLCATSDPTIFRAFFSLNVGNMGSDDNVTGVYPDYTKTDEMSFAQVDSAAKQGDADYFPNPLEVARMAAGTYGKAVASDATKAANGQAVRGWSGDVGGYYEADIAYNAETGRWECRPVSGGFHLGGGVNFSWFFNAFVGPVPVTLSLTLGATMELSMDMQRGNYWTIPGGADQITGMDNYAGMSSSGIEEEVKSEDTVRTFRLTKNSDLDENPQITTVTFGTGDDAVERFVIAWHTERAIQAANEEGKLVNTGETQSDIRLAAMDRSGVLYENMPESLGRATEGTGETVGSNFRLVKNAGSMDDLSILWVDSVSGGADEEAYSKGAAADAVAAAYQNNVGHDVLKAVKFVKGGNSYTVSGTVEVAEMESGTLIDHFDAYVNEEKKVKSVILGTNYPTPTPEFTPETHPEKFEKREVMISDGGEETPATITLPIPVTGMYSATAEFTNRIEMPAVMLEYDKLFPDSDIDVQFTVRNSGKAPVTGLMIVPVVNDKAVMEEDQAYYTSAKDPVYGEDGKTLNLLPNRDLTVTAKVPVGPEVENKDYAIIATFTEGSEKQQVELKGTLNLDIPDVGISKVTVVREGDGLRTLRYSLYNALSAKLADQEDEWRVKVGFYADRDYTKPLEGIVGADIESGTKVPLEMIISDPEKLALIDAGGYSDQVTLSVLDFENMKDEYGNPQEIPAAGIPVYVKAWIEAPEKETEQQRHSLLRVSPEKQYNPTSEYIPINNETSIQLDNLALREEEDLSITASLDNSDEEKGSVVTVEVKYNWLGGTANGNLIVTLFDADGEPLERQQLYDSENPGNLLNLSKEGSAEKVFTFDEKGAYVEVAFTDLVLDEANAELFSVTLTGATVTYDPEKRTYFATGANLTSGILDILPRDPEAEILLDDEKYDVNDPKSIALSYGITEWIIKVTSQAGDDPLDGTAYEEYKLVLDNKLVTASSGGGGGGGSGAGAGYTVSVTENTGNGTVTVKPDQARYGQTVTITAQPDKGYQVGSVIVTDANGGKVTVTSKGDGTYTFIMPDSKVTVEVTFVPEGQWVNPFVDVAEDAWYYDGVKYVHQNGLMAGTSANTFEPETDTTRAMLVTILYRLEGSPSMEDEIWGYPYADVEAQSWYGTAVYWARLHGIVKGYSDELFGPGDVITREQMAVILYRYAQYKGYDVSARGDLGKYTDGDQTSSWALEAVRWANAAGLINGTDNAALLPQGSATRAQAAAILTRFCQTSEK